MDDRRSSMRLAIAALVATGLLAAAVALDVAPRVTHATQALVLVLPVVLAALSGRPWLAVAAVAAATATFVLILPPYGSMTVAVFEDLIGLATFSAVALVVALLVARRIELLRRLERQHASLLRSVSHDLRTPLASIQAAASEVRSGPERSREATGELLDLVCSEAQRLDRLVANLLSMSRVDAGPLVPQLRPVDLADLVGAAAARLARLQPDTPVEVDVPDDLPLVAGDPAMLEQIITNVLENAIRHSPPGAEVRVAATADARQVLMTIDDHGPGVPPEQRATVFEPFRSGRTPGASGVGLAICTAIAQAHHGSIDVVDAPGGGARFRVRLPVAAS